MDTIGLIIISVWVIIVILSSYISVLIYKMRAILDKNKIKTHYFSFYWSFKLFKDFIEENEFEDSVRMKYIRLYKKAMLDKKNRLKIQKIYYTRRDSVYYRPMPWHDIKEESFETEHFGIISDSVVYLKMSRQEQIN